MKLGQQLYPVTEDDCRRWLALELEALTKRFHEKLEYVRRTADACDLVEELAEIYAEANPHMQASRIDLAFMRKNIVIDPQMLADFDLPAMAVMDEGGPVLCATRAVRRATGVTKYAITAQRNHRRRERQNMVDTLAPRKAADEEEERCA